MKEIKFGKHFKETYCKDCVNKSMCKNRKYSFTWCISCYADYLKKQNKQILGMLDKYNILSRDTCEVYCGKDGLAAICDSCMLVEHRLECVDFIDTITRKKIEDKEMGNTIPCLGDDLPY